jgi:hypothetical protein
VIEKQGMQKEEAETSGQRDSPSILRGADNGWLRAGLSQRVHACMSVRNVRASAWVC